MNVVFVPILRDLRAIYDLDGVMDRYQAYVRLMTKAKGELLPLGDFSPMGKRQKGYLDELIGMDAESIARDLCAMAPRELDASFRLILVVVDEPTNGWTQRCLTEADWRFASMAQPKLSETPWIVVHLWTTNDDLEYVPPTASYVKQQVRAAVFRAHYRMTHGAAETLAEMLEQEGAVMKFSGEEWFADAATLKHIAEVARPILNSKSYPSNFAMMFGDKAAECVGYEKLGVPERGGFALALSLMESAIAPIVFPER